jgi:hypothetical protein
LRKHLLAVVLLRIREQCSRIGQQDVAVVEGVAATLVARGNRMASAVVVAVEATMDSEDAAGAVEPAAIL